MFKQHDSGATLTRKAKLGEPTEKEKDWSKLARFDQLFCLARYKAAKLKASKSQDQRDWELQRPECTFRPKFVSKYGPSAPRYLDTAAKKIPVLDNAEEPEEKDEAQRQMERAEKLKMKEKLKELLEKSQKKDIERRQQAARDRNYLKACKAVGKIAEPAQKAEKDIIQATLPAEEAK